MLSGHDCAENTAGACIDGSQSLLEFRCFPDPDDDLPDRVVASSQSLLELRCFPDLFVSDPDTGGDTCLNLC